MRLGLSAFIQLAFAFALAHSVRGGPWSCVVVFVRVEARVKSNTFASSNRIVPWINKNGVNKSFRLVPQCVLLFTYKMDTAFGIPRTAKFNVYVSIFYSATTQWHANRCCVYLRVCCNTTSSTGRYFKCDLRFDYVEFYYLARLNSSGRSETRQRVQFADECPFPPLINT